MDNDIYNKSTNKDIKVLIPVHISIDSIGVDEITKDAIFNVTVDYNRLIADLDAFIKDAINSYNNKSFQEEGQELKIRYWEK